MESLKDFSCQSVIPGSLSVAGSSAEIGQISGSGESSNPLTSLRVAGSTSASSFNTFNSRAPASSESSSPSSGGQQSQDYGRPFVQMVKENSKYGPMFRVTTQYKVKLSHGTRRNVHWFLMVKVKESDLPYLTIEITTTNLTDLIPTTRIIEPSSGCWEAFSQRPEKVGVYNGSLQSLCQEADRVVGEMECYNLLTSNCQHFCNNLLRKIGLRTFPTTIGPETTLEGENMEFDLFTKVTRQIMEGAPALIGVVGASTVGSAIGAPQVVHSVKNRYKSE